MKKIIYLISLILAVTFTLSGGAVVASEEADKAAINKIMDGFHDAAAQGNKDRYLGYFTEHGVFMGTDDWERWPLNPEFTEFVEDSFKDGTGWTYKAISREIAFAPDHKVAWFDEITTSKKWGLFRGTGVLLKGEDGWKVAHYSMSMLVPNEVWPMVSDLNKAAVIRREEAKAKSAEK